jgi:hypothetical protein
VSRLERKKFDGDQRTAESGPGSKSKSSKRHSACEKPTLAIQQGRRQRGRGSRPQRRLANPPVAALPVALEELAGRYGKCYAADQRVLVHCRALRETEVSTDLPDHLLTCKYGGVRCKRPPLPLSRPPGGWPHAHRSLPRLRRKVSHDRARRPRRRCARRHEKAQPREILPTGRDVQTQLKADRQLPSVERHRRCPGWGCCSGPQCCRSPSRPPRWWSPTEPFGPRSFMRTSGRQGASP